MQRVLFPLFGCLTLVVACSGDTGARPDVFHVIDSYVEIDGPKPIFRDASLCGPGTSGASGVCQDMSASSDAADTMVPDTVVPDSTIDTTADQCVPPTACVVEFSFDKIGSETTAALHGDFNGIGTVWAPKMMTLDSNRWQVSAVLEDGQRLTYKFVVDEDLPGETWFADAANPNQEDDGLGGKNSILDVVCDNPCD
ncbi:MAG: hypothetical protein JRH20_10295 [Deltaproteobacteria bacterium]|nr:hypothetical protein [Deltaproteobacteria bacterium]